MNFVLRGLAVVAAVFATPMVEAKSKGCPPGLAKKAVPCVPPGQAKKAYGGSKLTYPYKVGYRLDTYSILRDPGRYGLDPRATYSRTGGYVYQIDAQTREVLDLIGAVSAILD